MKNILQVVNTPITENTIIPLTRVYTDKNVKVNIDVPTRVEVEKLCRQFNFQIENIYMTKYMFSPFIYWDGEYVLIELIQLKRELLDMIRFTETRTFLERLVKKQEFEKLFWKLEGRYAPFIFNKMKHNFEDDVFVELFKEVYAHQEYNFDMYDDLSLSKLRNSKLERENVKKNVAEYIEDGFVTIYRGEGSQSTNYVDALSWTLKYDIAHWFSKRFDSDGVVYKARVKVEDILCYIERECEVLVKSKDLIDIEVVKQPKLTDYDDIVSQFSDVIDLYDEHKYHSKKHISNVIYFTSILADKIKLQSKKDKGFLLTAAAWHDIGRSNDGVDPEHGKKSYERYLAEGNKHNDYIQFLIENHCIEDSEAHKNMINYYVLGKRAKQLLSILKDADALDRVRFGDLDLEYLRNKESLDLLATARICN